MSYSSVRTRCDGQRPVDALQDGPFKFRRVGLVVHVNVYIIEEFADMHVDGGVAGTTGGYLLSGLAPTFMAFLPFTRLFFAEDNSLRASDKPRRTDFVSASRRLFLLILVPLVL